MNGIGHNGKENEATNSGNCDKYRLLFENLHSAFAVHEMIYDDDGRPVDYRFLEINRAFEEMTGLEKNQVLGKTVLQVLPNTDSSLISRFANVAYTGKPTAFEHYSQNLERFYEGWAYRPQEGQFAVIFTDISSYKTMEKLLNQYRDNMEELADQRAEQLIQSEQRYQMLFNSTIEPILFVDSRGMIVEWNHAAASLLGFSPEELRTMNINDLVASEEVSGSPDSNEEAASQKKGSPVFSIHDINESGMTAELHFRRKGKSCIPVRITGNSIGNGDDQKYFLIFSDNSIEKNNKRELIEAKDQAERANRIKSNFLSNISHEIRTPIHAILGMVHLLEDTRLDARQMEYLKNISRSADSLFHSINGIIDFSKVESGKLQIEPRSFLLVPFLQDLVSIHEMNAREKGLEFRMVLEDTLPSSLIGDPFRISQLLGNLLAYAVSAADTGTVVLSVSEMIQLRGITHLEFSIAVDNGPGLNEDTLFSPFAYGNTYQEQSFPTGTAVGLSLSRELAVLMGGKIQIQENDGVNTGGKLHVRLPLRIQESGKGGQLSGSGSELLKNSRILLVEDHELSRKYLEELITQAGADLKTAVNGRDAVAMVQESDFDIVLMDIRMPVMDGLTAAREIRKLEKPGMRKLVILAITAHSTIEDIRECWDAGMNGHISKPVRPRDLTKQLAAWLTATRG